MERYCITVCGFYQIMQHLKSCFVFSTAGVKVILCIASHGTASGFSQKMPRLKRDSSTTGKVATWRDNSKLLQWKHSQA